LGGLKDLPLKDARETAKAIKRDIKAGTEEKSGVPWGFRTPVAGMKTRKKAHKRRINNATTINLAIIPPQN